jgi:hypothetical protein
MPHEMSVSMSLDNFEPQGEPRTGAGSDPTCDSKVATMISNILGCPIKCPVCVCDFMCHACAIVFGANFKPDGSLNGLLADEHRQPGCCTAFVSPCCPRFCINPQKTAEDRSKPRMALQLTELWCRAVEQEGLVYWATKVLCAPCALTCWACLGCISCCSSHLI